MDIATIKSNNLAKIDKMLEDEDGINVMFSRKWVEHEAANFLQQELNKYRGIFDASGIATKDKGISYDGRIEVMNNASEKGNELIGSIDVQVKGTCVNKINKGNSKFTIEITHLENYTKNPFGVLLFVVQIQKDTLEKKLFYRYLLPVDLQKIFMTLNVTKSTKSIIIYPIDQNQKNMLKRKCLEFLKARNMQAGKRIVILDEREKPLGVLVQDFREDKNDYLKDNVYIYVKLNNDEGFIPAIMSKGGKIGAVGIINEPIIIKGIKFYDYVKKIIEEDTILYQYGENVIYNTNARKFDFKFQGSIDEIINDFKFALMIMEITGKKSKKLFSILETKLNVIEEFQNNLKKINIILKNKFTPFKNIDYINMRYFNDIIKNDKEIIKKIDASRLYVIKLCNKNIVLFLEKEEKRIRIYNFFDNISLKFVITVKNNDEYISICPYSLLIDTLNFEDILNFDKSSVSISVQNCENNDVNREYMNLLALSFINSYDKTKEEEFYQLAEEILDRLLEWSPSENTYIINKMQLIRRKRIFTNEEMDKIYRIKNEESNNTELMYGISILLENKSDINYYYNKLDEKVKKEFSKYPIEHLKFILNGLEKLNV